MRGLLLYLPELSQLMEKYREKRRYSSHATSRINYFDTMHSGNLIFRNLGPCKLKLIRRKNDNDLWCQRFFGFSDSQYVF
jgi:hypothetical protein